MSHPKKEYCLLTIRIDQNSMDIINQLREDTGLSVREIVGYSSKPCECCRAEMVTAYNSKDKSVKIKRGILFHSMLTKHGSYTIKENQ